MGEIAKNKAKQNGKELCYFHLSESFRNHKSVELMQDGQLDQRA